MPPSTVTRQVARGERASPVSTNSSSRSPTRRNVEWPTPTMSFGADSAGAALGDRLAVDVRAVVRTQVADLEAAVGRRVELGACRRETWKVGDDQLVLQRTADAHDAAEARAEGGRSSGCGRRRPAAPPRSTGSLTVRHLPAPACCAHCCCCCCGSCACWGACCGQPGAPPCGCCCGGGCWAGRRRCCCAMVRRGDHCGASALPCTLKRGPSVELPGGRRAGPISSGGSAGPGRRCRWSSRGPR